MMPEMGLFWGGKYFRPTHGKEKNIVFAYEMISPPLNYPLLLELLSLGFKSGK